MKPQKQVINYLNDLFKNLSNFIETPIDNFNGYKHHQANKLANHFGIVRLG